MNCPKCNASADVRDSRQRGGQRYRRYRCTGPERHRFTTIEVIATRTSGQYAIESCRTCRRIRELATDLDHLTRHVR